jgi:fatty-acyl-CoA synthase
MRQIERLPASWVAVESGEHRLTHGELRALSNRLANGLLGLGLTPGDRVAYVAGNHLEYFVLEFALLKAGLTKVPLNPRITGDEILRSLALAQVRAVVADAGTAESIEQAGGLDPSVRGLVVGVRDGWTAVDAVIAQGSPAAPSVQISPDDVYHIRFSSGSTGTPKGIAISQRGARAAILGNTFAMSLCGPVDRPRTLQVAPLVYAGGWSVLPTWLRGGTSVVLPRFDADETLKHLVDDGIDWMFAVPTMLRRISQSALLPTLSQARISCLMLAGEPAAVPALEVVTQYTDALAQSWGQTEAPASTTLVTREEMKRPDLWTSIGRPIPGVEFSLVVDGEVLESPEPGVEGELVIRSESIASALLGADDEYRRRKLADGWWRTSDLARFDDEGRVSIVGRASETIITGGTNIQPVEIERALEQDDLVREAVVVGVPDPQWGETPAAIVYAPGFRDTDEAQLWSGLRDRLARFKHPRHLFVSLEPIPRSSGESKVARGEMKRLIESWVADPSIVPSHVTRLEGSRG